MSRSSFGRYGDDFDAEGPTTRRILYIDRARGANPAEIGQDNKYARPRAIRSLSEDDGNSEVERARRRARIALTQFRNTVQNTARDVILAARSLGTCTMRWLDAERTQRVASGSPESDGADGAMSSAPPEPYERRSS